MWVIFVMMKCHFVQLFLGLNSILVSCNKKITKVCIKIAISSMVKLNRSKIMINLLYSNEEMNSFMIMFHRSMKRKKLYRMLKLVIFRLIYCNIKAKIFNYLVVNINHWSKHWTKSIYYLQTQLAIVWLTLITFNLLIQPNLKNL